MFATTDQNGRKLYRNIRRDSNGTWSVNVWWGDGTTLRRYYGYATRADARDGDISEVPAGGRIGEYTHSKNADD